VIGDPKSNRKTYTLGEIATFLSGGTPNRQTPKYWNGDIPWLSAKDLKRFRLVDSIEKVTEEGSLNGTRLVEAGTVLILVRGMTLMKDVPVGVACRPTTFNQDLKALIPLENVDATYLAYYLTGNKNRLLALVDQAGHGTGRLSTELLSDFNVEVPPLREQQRISEILSTWDTAIIQVETLIAAKNNLKRGLMQQLLTGKKRFQEFANCQWQRMTISDLTVYRSRVTPKPEKPFTALGIRSHGKGTFLKPDFHPSKIEMTELFEVKKNDLIVNITFAWEGAIAIAGEKDDGALVSHRFPTYEFNTDLAIPEFFRHVIVQKWFVERLGLISPGGAGRNRVLNRKDFGKIKVLLPSIDEQRRIAAVLNACDKEIELLNKQLAAFKRQRLGLMQKLLTGQIPVKVKDESKEEMVNA
jgi:type I restriction enzyme S subunit